MSGASLFPWLQGDLNAISCTGISGSPLGSTSLHAGLRCRLAHRLRENIGCRDEVFGYQSPLHKTEHSGEGQKDESCLFLSARYPPVASLV